MEITLTRGGTAERRVEVDSIQIPDLWHLAMWLKDAGKSTECLKSVPLQGQWADMVLETWRLAHDMRRALSEIQQEVMP